MEVQPTHRYIEFVGPHTSGKTTTMRTIIEQDLVAPYSCVTPYELKRSQLHFYLSVPWLALRQWRHLWFLTSFFLRYTKLQWTNFKDAWQYLFKMIILHPYYKRFSFDVWIKDDMLHLLPHIVFRDGIDVQAAFREYVEHFLYLYDGLIYMDVARETMLTRAYDRNKEASEWYQNDRLVVYERTLLQSQALKTILREQQQVPYLELNGTDDLDSNTSQAAAFIKQIVAGSASPL